jgi:hypothetical protein
MSIAGPKRCFISRITASTSFLKVLKLLESSGSQIQSDRLDSAENSLDNNPFA